MAEPAPDSFTECRPGAEPTDTEAPESAALDPEPSAPEPTGAAEFSPRPAKRAVWVGVAAGVVFLAVASLAVYRWMTPGVTADALLYIDRHPQHILPDIPPGAAEDERDFQDYCRTQQALVKSRMVLYAALRDPKVASLKTLRQQTDAVEWLEDRVRSPHRSREAGRGKGPRG
jgi:hypothetical protein